jgi:transmembrane sensor
MSEALERKAQAEAAVWMVKLYSDDRTPEFEAGLREWLAADPRNARHFEEATQMWEMAGAVNADGVPRVQRRKTPKPGSTLRWRWAMALTVLVIGAWALWASYGRWQTPSYATGLGEQRIVMLKDGSRIVLNTRSRLQVEFSDRERRVELANGEAFFEVAQEKARPFVVTAGQRRVTALGTSFVVRYEANRMAVTLVEGKVLVAEASNEAPQSMTKSATLTAGERLTFTSEKPPALDSPRIEAVTAWRHGEVLFDNNTLSEAVAEMNRYDERQLIIDDPDLTHLLVSGIYRSGDSASFARGLGELHGVRYTERSGEIHLHR